MGLLMSRSEAVVATAPAAFASRGAIVGYK